MDPLDFLRVADTLSNSAEEAEIRTAVGRAYYAVFNYIRSYLAANNLRLSNHQIHDKLPKCIMNSGINDIQHVAQKLEELRHDRIEADYEMHSHDWNPDTCTLIVDKARETVNNFQAYESPELVSGARNYLVNVCGERLL